MTHRGYPRYQGQLEADCAESLGRGIADMPTRNTKVKVLSKNKNIPYLSGFWYDQDS